MARKNDKERNPIKTAIVIIIAVVCVLIYIKKDTIEKVWFDYIWWSAGILFVGLLIQLIIGLRRKRGRICIVCKKELKTYRNTVYCLRWNSGRKPTPLFFCLKHGRAVMKKKYVNTTHREDEDTKTQTELWKEMRGVIDLTKKADPMVMEKKQGVKNGNFERQKIEENQKNGIFRIKREGLTRKEL